MNEERLYPKSHFPGIRLCRLMCGKALPFRTTFSNHFGGEAEQSPPELNGSPRAGKPKAFRTSGGIAEFQCKLFRQSREERKLTMQAEAS